MRAVGVHAAAIQQLLEVGAVAHGVGGILRCLVGHWRRLLVFTVRSPDRHPRASRAPEDRRRPEIALGLSGTA